MNKLYNFKYLIFLVLPIIAVAVWCSPILFKGYPASEMTENIVLGKNIAKTGMYAMENDLNVLLSSDLIKEEGHTSFVGNKLTGYLYALVFKLFGSLNWNQLILFSAILNALTLLIFVFLVFYLFNFRTSLFFSLIYIFTPVIWRETQYLGFYEFALFFISLFFLFYFLGSPRPSSVEAGGEAGQRRPLFLIFSGLFLALAGLARETFLLFIPVIFIYLLLKKEKRMIIFIFIPLFIILSIFYLPDFLAGHNNYLLLLPITKTPQTLESNDFMRYGEVYPDPYTYNFDKNNFLKEYENRRDSLSLIPSLYLEKAAVDTIGDYHMAFGRRILLSILLLVDHAGKFISWEDVGGPFIFLLMLLGLYYLKKEQTPLFQLFICLFFGIIFLLSFVVLVGRNHIMDFGWILTLLATLGLLALFSMIETHLKLDKKKTFFVSNFILAMVLYSLLLANHSYFGRVYDNKDNLMVLVYASKIDKLNISDKDVIALPGVSSSISLNYLKDKSVVVFQQETIEKLLETGKLNPALKSFGVTYIVGYPEDLSKKILKAANVMNIGSSDVEEVVLENYNTKNWLMNFIK